MLNFSYERYSELGSESVVSRLPKNMFRIATFNQNLRTIGKPRLRQRRTTRNTRAFRSFRRRIRRQWRNILVAVFDAENNDTRQYMMPRRFSTSSVEDVQTKRHRSVVNAPSGSGSKWYGGGCGCQRIFFIVYRRYEEGRTRICLCFASPLFSSREKIVTIDHKKSGDGKAKDKGSEKKRTSTFPVLVWMWIMWAFFFFTPST